MTVQATETTSKQSLFDKLIKRGKSAWGLAIVMALIASGAALSLIGNAASSEVYYVLGRDVPARTPITQDMLVQREARVGQAPPNAFDIVDVAQSEIFTRYALKVGDVVTPSNAGPLTRITADVPDNFVAASFPAEPELAVAGKVRAGDFIDVIASSSDEGAGQTARVVLAHALVLDVTVTPDSIAAEATAGQEGEQVATPGPESEAARSGIPAVYTVALSPTDAAKLALIRSMELFVVLSANVPDAVADVSAQTGNLFTDPVGDSSAGTFGSVFIKRWDHAFEPDNVFVDLDGTLWRVTAEKQWAEVGSSRVLDAGDVPPGYLPLPEGLTFTDAEGTFWLATSGDLTGENATGPDVETAVVWTVPGTRQSLAEGDNPDGFDPHAEFDKAAAEQAAADDATATPAP